VRVVAGELGGRRLAAPRGVAVRPTSDRVREALFSILGDVTGLAVLDLFAGTGALAIEAISRGAARATLVDRDPGPARANVEALAIGGRCRIVGEDAARFLDRDDGQYDLVLCDPPYRLARRLISTLDTSLATVLAPGARVVVESSGEDVVGLAMPLVDERRYGATTIRIHEADVR
jgi:16S rRNA (guanine966-N2)-methyltransferase